MPIMKYDNYQFPFPIYSCVNWKDTADGRLALLIVSLMMGSRYHCIVFPKQVLLDVDGPRAKGPL